MIRWRSLVQRMDHSALTAVTVSDHFLVARQDPLPALAAIASHTSRVRVMSLLLANDYRHPVITHKAAATIDVISGGRFDLGVGAGYLAAEYAAAGMEMDPPGIRVERLAEAVDIICALFGDKPVDFRGQHYTIHDLVGSPVPVQRPRPPLVIGGGGRRMLELAGRHADIVGVHASLRRGTAYDAGVLEDMLPERMARKMDWARRAADGDGRDPDALDYLSIAWTCRVVDSPAQTPKVLAEVCDRYGVSVKLGRRTVGLLVGTVEECVEQLLDRRETLGLNYIDFGAAAFTEVEPLLEALA
jgi:probable F420-dependent oxidoreductase